MKIRIYDNQLRVRINSQDKEKLMTEGRIDSSLKFPNNQQLKCSLELLGDQSSASVENNHIQIFLAHKRGIDWISSKEVSIEFAIKSAGADLTILIEKDIRDN